MKLLEIELVNQWRTYAEIGLFGIIIGFEKDPAIVFGICILGFEIYIKIVKW